MLCAASLGWQTAAADVIKGIVADRATGAPLVGVFIKDLKSQQVAVSDGDGRFVLDLSRGRHILQSSYTGYRTTNDTVDVKGDAELRVSLAAMELSLGNATVVGTRNRESATAALSTQRGHVVAMQQVAAAEMSRKGLGNAEVAVAAVSGVSRQEGVKNVLVRGLGDRYNATMLNGFPIPSEDSENKNIALDLFSSDVIRSVDVNKVFSGETSGEVTGAHINIGSKEVRKRSELSIDVSAGVNSRTPGADYLSADGMNLLGVADAGEPAQGVYAFPNSLDPSKVSFPLNASIYVSGGRRLMLGGKMPLSVFAAVSYTHLTLPTT